MKHDADRSTNKALLVGTFTKREDEKIAIEHLTELSQLAETDGIPVVSSCPMMIRKFTAATFISSGKVDELKSHLEENHANLVIFDDEISPVQQRNLENLLKVPVMDRSEVILAVFAHHATSHEAKLQVELARLRYIAPRLKRMWTHLSRQSGGGGGMGGGGYLKGEGEKQIELDRRIIQHRLEQLQVELKEVQQYRVTQRTLRERNEVPVFAIIGYTNAGKSSLMKKLTLADVLIENKLFATLDTTTRQYVLPNNQEVLIIDTVGFIRKLPHLLVAAFKSTLEEATQADILIHVIDGSHPQAMDQAKTTLEVLEELHAKDRPILTVINKVDLIKDLQPDGIVEHNITVQKLKMTYPRAVLVSAETGEGMEALLDEMMYMLKSRLKRVMLKISQADYHLIAGVIRIGHIYNQVYDENDVLIDVELPISHAERLKQYWVS